MLLVGAPLTLNLVSLQGQPRLAYFKYKRCFRRVPPHIFGVTGSSPVVWRGSRQCSFLLLSSWWVQQAVVMNWISSGATSLPCLLLAMVFVTFRFSKYLKLIISLITSQTCFQIWWTGTRFECKWMPLSFAEVNNIKMLSEHT